MNGLPTIEAAVTHAFPLSYFHDKMKHAGIQNPKKVRNAVGFLISGNQSMPFSNKGFTSNSNSAASKAVNNQGAVNTGKDVIVI